MLQIVIPKSERWDEETESFIVMREQTLQLEHSLVSLSKWESKWNKPFLSNQEKTNEEIFDYIRCMILTKNIDYDVLLLLNDEHITKIKEYIEAPMTATTFSNRTKGGSKGEQITSELIYYWMIAMNIPWECQKWHLNRLMTLIRVCEIKNQPPKKMSKREVMSRNAALNAARKKQMNTRG